MRQLECESKKGSDDYRLESIERNTNKNKVG